MNPTSQSSSEERIHIGMDVGIEDESEVACGVLGELKLTRSDGEIGNDVVTPIGTVEIVLGWNPATGRGETGGVLTTCDGGYDCVTIVGGIASGAAGALLVAGVAVKVGIGSVAFRMGMLDGAGIATGAAIEPYVGFKGAGACVNCTTSGEETCGTLLSARGSGESALVSVREPESAFAKYGSSS